MSNQNGKGDSPRSCFSKQFKKNYDQINWKEFKTQQKLDTLKRGWYITNRVCKKCKSGIIGNGYIEHCDCSNKVDI